MTAQHPELATPFFLILITIVVSFSLSESYLNHGHLEEASKGVDCDIGGAVLHLPSMRLGQSMLA